MSTVVPCSLPRSNYADVLTLTDSLACSMPPFFQVLLELRGRVHESGGLICPSLEFERDDETRIRNSEVKIRRFAISLGVPSSGLIDEALGLRVLDID